MPNITKRWDLLQIIPKLKKEFQERPTIVYKRNINQKGIIGNNTILSNKEIRKKQIDKNTFSVAHATQECMRPNLCSQHVEITSTFKIYTI